MNPYNQEIVRAPVILFLGAGASADLGKPLMAEFLDKVQGSLQGAVSELVACIRRERGSDLEAMFEDLQELDSLTYVNTFTAQTLDRDEMITRNSRELLPGGGGSMARADTPIFKAMPFGHDVIHSALSELRKAVIREYGQVPIEHLHDLYEPLWSKIFEPLGIGATLPVFTTNYDPAVEEFCEQSQTVLVNGFSLRATGSHHMFWTRAAFDTYTAYSSKRNVVLFKLHGSAKLGEGPAHTSNPLFPAGAFTE